MTQDSSEAAGFGGFVGGTATSLFSRSKAGQDAHVDIPGKGLELFNEGAIAVHRSCVQGAPGAELRHVFLEQVGDVDDRRLVLAVGLDIECADDGREVGSLDGLGDGIGSLGADAVADIAQEHLFAVQFPAHDTVPHGHAGVRIASGGFRNLDHPEQIGVKGVGRYFII